jgi:hypothetical protein
MRNKNSIFETFGKSDPRKMPSHLFSGAMHLDYTTAVRADFSKQNCSICPRYWYIDAAFRCARCGDTFVFTALEQQHWYEELGFWVDSIARHCGKCRCELRELKSLRQEYDRDVAAVLNRKSSVERKRRLLEVVDAFETSGVALPQKIRDTRRVLEKQVERIRHSADDLGRG